MMTWIVGIKQCNVIGYPDINTILQELQKNFLFSFCNLLLLVARQTEETWASPSMQKILIRNENISELVLQC